MNRILLIGAGNLGKRHLQSLRSSKFDLDIVVVEPSASARKAAEDAYNSSEIVGGSKQLRFVEAIEGLDFEPEVAIIATPATGRLGLLKSTLALGATFLVLEKVAFNSEEDIRDAISLVEKSEAKVWINCPRRLNAIYRELKTELVGEDVTSVQVSGSNYGLACNFVHFIDLFAFLCDRTEYQVNLSGIERIENSKRGAYIEFAGRVTGEFRSGPLFRLECDINQESVSVQIRIETEEQQILIDETEGKLVVSNSAGAVLKNQSFQQPFQSQLTAPLVDELISAGDCGLTQFDESMALHFPFISGAYELYASKFEPNPRKRVPIT